MLINYKESILPEKFREVEAEACQAAVDQLINTNDDDVDL